MFLLDTATQLTPAPDGALIGHTHPDYANFRSPYGGWTAALAMRALLEAGASDELVSMTITFCGAIPDGPVEARMSPTRITNSLSYWAGNLSAGGAVCSQVLASFGKVRKGPSYTDLDFPADIPRPQDVPGGASTLPLAFLNRYEQRWARGTPMAENEKAHSLVWARDAEQRPWDFIGLAAFADLPLPRLFMKPNVLAPIATVVLSITCYATRAELADLGGDFLLLETSARRAARGFIDHASNIWSIDGQLLATTEQQVWVKVS